MSDTHATGAGSQVHQALQADAPLARSGAQRRGGSARFSKPAETPWKFDPPHLGAQLLARERLSARLEATLGKRAPYGAIMLVSAPAGYGKTTALAQWASQTAMPTLWYTLEADDDDPVLFLQRLAYLFQQRFDCPRKQMEVFGALARLTPGAASREDIARTTRALIGDIRRKTLKPLTLVLANLSELPRRSATLAALDDILNRPPDHLRIALETREAHGLTISAALTQRRINGLGADELRLSDEEFDALVAMVAPTLDARGVERLRTLCSGWITGALLASGALLPTCLASVEAALDDDAPIDDTREHARIFDYLAREVIDALPDRARVFAERVATLSYMTAPMCAALLEYEPTSLGHLALRDAYDLLVALERRTGMVTRVGQRPQEPIFRFQPLLRQALLERLKDDHDEEALRALRRYAGDLLREQDAEEAAQQYAQAEAYDALAALIEARQGALLRSACGATLLRWLNLLPEELRYSYPQLQALPAELLRQAGKPREAVHAARRAYRALTASPRPRADLLARTLVARAAAAYTLGWYKAARMAAEQALRLAPEDADDLRAQASFALASSVSSLLGPIAADACLVGVEERIERRRDLGSLARLRYMRSNFALARGDYAEVEREAEAALLAAQEADARVDAINSRINRASARLGLGRAHEAHADLETALEESEAVGYTIGRCYALINRGYVELHTRQYEAAAASFGQALDDGLAQHDRRLYGYTVAGLAQAMIFAGRPEAAVALLTPILGADRWRGGTTLESHQLSLAAQLGLAQSRLERAEEAQELLCAAIRSAEEHRALAESLHARLFLAAHAQSVGDEAQAARILGELLELADQSAGAATLLHEVIHLPMLWPLLERHGHPVAGSLFERINATCASASAPIRATSDVTLKQPARVFLFGEPRVLVGAEQVTAWRVPAARELLLYLADQRGPVAKDVVVGALWGEKEQEEAETAFRKARYYVAKALGVSKAIVNEQGWRLAVPCVVDTHEFERLLATGEQLEKQGDLHGALVALRQARSYYTGEFMASHYGSEWTMLRRERLNRLIRGCRERLARLETLFGHFDEASQVYYEMLDHDSCDEVAHRGLMRYFQARGAYAQAIEQFQRCARELKAAIGVTPGPETLELCEEIAALMREKAQAFVAKAR